MDSTVVTMITSLLTSTAISSIIITIYSARNKDKRKYITDERQQWRKEQRDNVVDFVTIVRSAFTKVGLIKLYQIEALTHMRLNPNSFYDEQITDTMKDIITLYEPNNPDNSAKIEKKLDTYIDLMSRLTKHDWDRLKLEIGDYVQEQTKNPPRPKSTICNLLFKLIQIALFLLSLILASWSILIIFLNIFFFHQTDKSLLWGGMFCFLSIISCCLFILFDPYITKQQHLKLEYSIRFSKRTNRKARSFCKHLCLAFKHFRKAFQLYK